MINQEVVLLKNFESNALWFNDNLINLKEKFKNNFVAVENKKVIEHGKNMEEVVEKLKSKNKNPSNTFIDFVPEKGLIMIF